MDGCIMCENTLTTAASQKMLVLLEDVFQVSIVANINRALFVCSRCEVNVHFIEGAMKLKKEMEEHLLETLDLAQPEGGGGSSLPRPKRRRHDTGDGAGDTGVGATGPGAQPLPLSSLDDEAGREFGGRGEAAVAATPPFGIKRPGGVVGGGQGEGFYNRSSAAFDPTRPVSYSMKRSRPQQQPDLTGRAPGLQLGLARGTGLGAALAAASHPDAGPNDLHRPMGNGRLLLPHEPTSGGGGAEHGGGRVYDVVERSMAGGLLRPHHLSELQQHVPGGGMAGAPAGIRRRRGFPCAQCGKVLRTRAWLTRHLQSCGSDSPFDDAEGLLTDQDSYSEDDADTTGDTKGDMSSLVVVDASTPSAASSTPPSIVCACKDCGKTFKRKTWLLKHAMQCVASRVGASARAEAGHAAGLASGMGGPNQVGSALTCHHCGKRYLGRYDKYREHVKQCGLRANGGLVVAGGGLGAVAGGGGGGLAAMGVVAGSAGSGGGGAAGVGENACFKCGEAVAGGGEELDKHVAECPGQASAENTVHTCPTCGRCYAKRYDYFLRHVRSCQRGDDRGGIMAMGGMGGEQAMADGEPCVCPRCSKMYRRADHLWQHMEMCRGIPGRNVGPHVCDKCGKTYGTRYDVLQRHVLTCKGIAAAASGQASAIELPLDTTQAAAQRSILGAAATGKEGGGSSSVGAGGGAGGGGSDAGSTLADGDVSLLAGAIGGGGRMSAVGADDASGGGGSAAARALSESAAGGSFDGANGRGAPTANECTKCGKVLTLRYDQFVRHVSKCLGPLPMGASPEVDSYMCQKCGRDFGREYELYLRHVDVCDGADEDGADDDDDGGDDEGSQHVCPGCGRTCETYEELWTHAQTCQSRGALLMDGDEAASAGPEDDGGSIGDAGGSLRASGKMRNMCAKCGKCYVLLTCYRKHVAKCMGGGGDTSAAAAAAAAAAAVTTNGGLYNGGMRRPGGEAYGASSGSPSTGSNPADDIENEDEDAAAAVGGDSTSPYECDNCGLSFGAHRTSFLKHVALCTGAAASGSGGGPASFPGGGAGNLHVCNYCGKHFVRLGNYTRHVQMCQYSAGGMAGAEGLRHQLHIKQCNRCLEAIPADQYVGHVERCYGIRAGASSLLHMQPDVAQLLSLGGGSIPEGFALSASSASALLAAQQKQVPPPSWTCPRCKKDFKQSGQYIRHISTCSMEFLKCPKCDFGRYYSDSKDFDNHVTMCRGKVGAAAGPAAGALATQSSSSSPLPMPSADQQKPSAGPVVVGASVDPDSRAPIPEGRPAAADHRQLIPSDPVQFTAAEYNPQSYLPSRLHLTAAEPSSITMTEAMDFTAPSTSSDHLQDDDELAADGAEFALQEEVVAASDGDAELAIGGANSDGPVACDSNMMLA